MYFIKIDPSIFFLGNSYMSSFVLNAAPPKSSPFYFNSNLIKTLNLTKKKINIKCSSTKTNETEKWKQMPKWIPYTSSLVVSGAVLGPLLDAIHSRTQLQIYDSLPIDIQLLDFHSSFWVILLLSLYYPILGYSIYLKFNSI